MGLSAELGSLSVLPREIRDRIYAFALDFNYPKGSPKVPPARHGAALLRTSRRIYDEAIVVLYQCNVWTFWLDQEYNNPVNFSIMDCPGYKISFTHNRQVHPPSAEECIPIPRSMVRHLQSMNVEIGFKTGVNEVDIVTTMDQTLQGPERPTFRPVVDRVKELYQLLKECDKIHNLVVAVYSNERKPGSVQKVLEPITQLRGIEMSVCDIYQAGPTMQDGFELKNSYRRHLQEIMAMPPGIKAPEYVADESEGQEENGVFLLLSDPDDTAEDDEDDEEFEDYEAYHPDEVFPDEAYGAHAYMASDLPAYLPYRPTNGGVHRVPNPHLHRDPHVSWPVRDPVYTNYSHSFDEPYFSNRTYMHVNPEHNTMNIPPPPPPGECYSGVFWDGPMFDHLPPPNPHALRDLVHSFAREFEYMEPLTSF